MEQYSEALENRIAEIRAQNNFVPLDKVETGKFYWWHVVSNDDRVRMFPGIAVHINGNLCVCTSLSDTAEAQPAPVGDRVFGAVAVRGYNSVISVGRMYERAHNDEMAYKMWLQAHSEVSDSEWATRTKHRHNAMGRLAKNSEWIPKLAYGRPEARKALQRCGHEPVSEIQCTPDVQAESVSLLDRTLAKFGLQRIAKEV